MCIRKPVLVCVFCMLVLLPFSASAQEVLFKRDNFHTEVFLRVSPENIVSVARGPNENTLVVHLNRNISKPFSQKLEDPFVESIQGQSRTFTVTFHPTSDFAAFNDPEGVRFIATHPQQQEDILLSYGVGAPTLRRESSIFEDPAVEQNLRVAEKLTNAMRYSEALNILNNIVATTRSSYYQQEALLRTGNIYMKMAETINSEYYSDAANTFDRFITIHPDSNRLGLVMQLSALAKDRGGMVQEAIDAYRAIFNMSVDAQTRRVALERIGQLYTSVGQYERATEAYEQYLNNFRTDNERVRAAVGSIYMLRNFRDNAYNVFLGMTPEQIIRYLSDQEILNLAKIFSERGQRERAGELFAYLVSKDDKSTESVESMYHVAQALREHGDFEAYSETLLRIIAAAPASEYGLRALVEYAEQNYPTRSEEQWREFLAPIYVGEDVYDLRPRAQVVRIRALYKDGEMGMLLPMIDEYIATYSESPVLPFLRTVKEETLFELAVEAQNNKNYPRALQIYNQILVEFPETHRRDTIMMSMDDIYFDQIMTMFNNRRFDEVVNAVENRITENPPVIDRWLTLWEDAMYRNIEINIGVLSPRAIRIRSREYLSEMPRGRYVDDVKTVLVEAFVTPFNEAYKEGNYAEVISLYDENRIWLNDWPDQMLNANAKVSAASALLRLGMRDKATELFRTIPPLVAPEYAILGYALCERNITYDISRLSPDDFLRAMEAAQTCGDPKFLISLMNRYGDRRFALKAMYGLSKNISDESLREVILRDIHSQLITNPAGTQFEGFEEVFFDVGMLAYRKNDFRGALIPLRRYVDIGDTNSNRRAEAMFYLAKSLVAVNERDSAAQIYQQIVDTMPDSIFKSMAKSELEDSSWRQNLTR